MAWRRRSTLKSIIIGTIISKFLAPFLAKQVKTLPKMLNRKSAFRRELMHIGKAITKMKRH